MAKLHGFRCDRCGKEYDKNRSKNSRDTTGFNVIGFAFVNTAKQLDRYDLCDECIKELQAWCADPTFTVGAFGVDLSLNGEIDVSHSEEE